MFQLLGVLLLLGGAAIGGGYFWVESGALSPVAPGSTELVDFRVPKGATLNQVGRLLAAQHLIANPLLWRVYFRLHGGKSPEAGRHQVSAAMTLPALLETLAAPPLSDDVALTIVEGWRLRDVDLFLANSKLIAPGAYLEAASHPEQFKIAFPFEGATLEGYLLPETYLVPPGPVDLPKLIQRQLDGFNERFYQPNAAEIGASAHKLQVIVTIASMLEREEPSIEQRPNVAGVMYKRLEARTPLGIDATSRYRLADWNDRGQFLKALRDPTDPYNSRTKAGLPPTPIGAPSLPSLMAALRPIASEYWYYLHDGERHIHFSRNAEEHEAARKKYHVY